MSWAGNVPVVAARWPDHDSSLQAVKTGEPQPTPVVRVQPEAFCVVLADAALDGEAHGLIPASWSWPILWWWRELPAGSAVLVALAWIAHRRRRKIVTRALARRGA